MKSNLFKLLLLAVVAVLTGCGADNEYSNYRCLFLFDNSRYNNPVLATAMNPLSPGIFVRIYAVPANAGKRFMFESNQGGDPHPTDVKGSDAKRSAMLGIYNGVIVGHGNGTNPAVFYCYDNQCRNCYESSGLTRYALTMNTDGTATCKSCHRVYDMNNGGILASGDKGKGLVKYRATCQGSVLSINN